MLVIGVTGFRRCGKNSVTTILGKHGFQHYAFADALRSMAEAVNPVISLSGAAPETVNPLYNGVPYLHEFRYNDLVRGLGYEKAKDIPDFRHFLQRLGTEGVRATFGPEAWVVALHRKVSIDKPQRLAISDVRFQSEAAWVLGQGGKLWRVIRPGHGGTDPHPSEVEIPTLPASRELTASSLLELERAVIDALAEDLQSFASSS